MTTFNVSNVSQLESALTSAHGGDTIDLAAGTYSGLGTLSGLNYASDVTITSASASNEAVIAPFALQSSSNITFSDVAFSAAGSTAIYAYTVRSSSGITFDHDAFSGNLGASNITSEPSIGLGMWNNTNIAVTNSDFSYLNTGISEGSNNGVVLNNNSFHEMESDGIDNASSQNVQIQNNVFTDFHPSATDHPDAIQFWGAGTQNVDISGNLSIRGAGSTMQGVFMNDTNGWATGVTVSNNTVIGGAYNGIDITGADNVTVNANTISPYSDQESWIRLQNDAGVQETNNTSFAYVVDSSNTNLTQSGNVTTGTYNTDNGKALVTSWEAAHSGWTGTLPASVSALAPMSPSSGSTSPSSGSTSPSSGSTSPSSGSTAPSSGSTAPSSGSTAPSSGTSTTHTFQVSTVAQLETALASAHGGDTIQLAAGAYSGLGTLSGLNYASNVTITSADPTHQAVITPFYLQSSSNITFSHVTFDATGSTDPYAYRVNNSSGISFDHDAFHGNVGASNISSEPMMGLGMWNNTNVSVTNSDFSYLNAGISEGTNNGVVLNNNSFHELESDGIDNASSQNVQIENNVFTDFQPAAGDHPDAIQFWGSGTQNVTISGNLSVRGAGSTMQGVFMNDTNGWATGVTVSNNTIIGGAYNGIDVTGADNVTVQSNTIAPYSDQESWIRLQNNAGVQEINNSSYAYVVDGSNTNLTQSGNVTTGTYTTDGGAALVSQWEASHAGWTGTLPASIAALAPSSPASGSTAPSSGSTSPTSGSTTTTSGSTSPTSGSTSPSSGSTTTTSGSTSPTSGSTTTTSGSTTTTSGSTTTSSGTKTSSGNHWGSYGHTGTVTVTSHDTVASPTTTSVSSSPAVSTTSTDTSHSVVSDHLAQLAQHAGATSHFL